MYCPVMLCHGLSCPGLCCPVMYCGPAMYYPEMSFSVMSCRGFFVVISALACFDLPCRVMACFDLAYLILACIAVACFSFCVALFLQSYLLLASCVPSYPDLTHRIIACPGFKIFS
jgi:hypothetical protein